MTKAEFLAELEKQLSNLSKGDKQQWLDYYTEMIDDRIEEGLTEADAIEAIGTPSEIAQQIKSELPLAKLVRQRIKPKRKLRTWEITLLAVGSPLWASLLLALAAIVFSIYVSLWSVIISLWAVEVSFAACAVAGILLFIPYGILQGNFSAASFLLGAALVLAGISIFLFLGCKAITKGFCKATASLLRSLKVALSKPKK